MECKFNLEVVCEAFNEEEATHDIDSFIRIKNQNGCQINGTKLTFRRVRSKAFRNARRRLLSPNDSSSPPHRAAEK